MADGLRWEQRKKVTEVLSEDLPQMHDAIEASAGGPFHDQARELLAGMEEGELIDWITVAVYRRPDGSTTTCVHGDPELTNLQIKGLLHDAVWAAAHRE